MSTQLNFVTFNGLWFVDKLVEDLFLAEERERCYIRFLVANLVTAPAATYVATTANTTYLIVVCYAVVLLCAISGIADIIPLRMRRREEHQQEEIALSMEEGMTSVDKETDPHTQQLAKLHGYDRLHERLVVASYVIMALIAALAHQILQGNCIYWKHHDEDVKDHTGCPARVYPYWFFFVSYFSHIVSQPRFIFVCVANLVGIPLLALVSFHDTDTTTHILIIVFCVVFLTFATVLKFVDEQKHRQRFQTRLEFEQLHTEVIAQTASLRDFITRITPPHLRSRLKDSVDQVLVDTSDDAVCLVVHTRNAAQFMHGYLPTEAARHLALFRHDLEDLAFSQSVHQIRSLGDTTFLVSNLFHQDHRTTENAVFACIRVATNIILPDDGGAHKLEVCCGTASGYLLGMPVGNTCIRYDIFGAALREAQSLALQCPPGRVVNVSPSIAALMGERLVSAELEDTDTSDENNVVCGVMSPDNSAATSARESIHQTLTTRSNTSTTATDDLSASQQPNAAQPEAIEDLPSSSQATDTTFSKSASSFLSSATATNPFVAQSSMNFDALAHVSTSSTNMHSSTHMIRTEVPIAVPATNLDTVTWCCCVPHFTSEETTMAFDVDRLRTSFFSFYVTCLFCAAQTALVLVMGALDGPSAIASTGQFAAGIAILAFSAVILLLVGLRVATTAELHQWQQRVAMGTVLMCMIASGVLRPSLAGETTSALAFIFALAALFMGLSLRKMAFFITALFATQVVVVFFVLPRFTRTVGMVIVFLPVYLNAAIVSNKLAVALFSSSVRAREALDEVNMHERIRIAVQAALVPPQLADLCLTRDMLSGDPTLDIWGIDQCVTMLISVSGVDSAVGNGSVKNVAALQRNIDDRMSAVETALNRCPNKSLSIVKVFGGSVVVAGPFTEGLEANTAVQATADAVHLLKSLLASANAVSQNTSLGNVVNTSSLAFTAGVSVEQGIHVMIMSAFPQYDLMGPSVNTARKLVAAAPAEMVVVTQSFAGIYERECTPEEDVEILAAETWRLRDVGSLRVHRLRLAL